MQVRVSILSPPLLQDLCFGATQMYCFNVASLFSRKRRSAEFLRAMVRICLRPPLPRSPLCVPLSKTGTALLLHPEGGQAFPCAWVISGIFKGGDLNLGERHSRDTRDDGTVTLCALRTATVLSRDCRADFGRPLTKKVMSHSRDGPGVTAPLRTNSVPLTGVLNPPLSVSHPPLKKSPMIEKKGSGLPQGWTFSRSLKCPLRPLRGTARGTVKGA